MKRLITFVFLFFVVLAVEAEKTRFVMSAPNAVETGQQFRLSFTLNARGENLQLPPGLTDNFQILTGPSTGQSTSIQMINGKTTTQVTYTYTYILRAKKEGTFEIRPASIEVDGRVYESNSLTIQVVKPQPGTTRQQGGASSGSGMQNIELNEDNLFVRLDLSKRKVFKGEQIIATVKLYVNPNIPIAGFDEVNLPTYEGFFTQDIDIPQQISFTREVYNDRIYQVGVLKKTILFPQQTGKITIKPFSLSLLVRQQIRPRSFFDDFFDSYRTVRARTTSKPVTVQVENLPLEPAGFMGGVGQFTVKSEISNTEVSTNDAVTLKLTISGKGNLQLIQVPKLELPSDFEVYDPQTSENVKADENGMRGSKTIEYLFQPRFPGDYTIPGIRFVYFDPSARKYVTRTTPSYTLKVNKGTDEQSATVVSSLRKEDVQLIGQDIRFIKKGNPDLRVKGETFYGSLAFYLSYLISAFLFVIVFFIYRKKVRENANVALMRNRKASRVAIKRLREAASFMKQNNNEAFYEAVLRAFWGYLSDKLGIPKAELNRETAIEKLKGKGVEDELVTRFVQVIEQCEFARYAPAGGAEARNELYRTAVDTMTRLEKQIKK